MNFKLTTLKTALAASLALTASSSFAMDLMAAYQKALSADPSLQAADAALTAGREKTVQARSLFKPQVALSASLAQSESRSSSRLPAPLAELNQGQGSGQMHQVALQMVQPLYNAKSRADQQQLQQQAALAEIQHRQAQQDLMERVSEAYFGVLLAQEALRVVRAEEAAVQLQRERAQARFEVGRGKITEVQETQARYDSVLTREVSAQSTLELRRAQFRELTGVAAEGLVELGAGFVPLLPAPASLQAWQDRGMDSNNRVLVKQSELEIAAAEIGKYKLSGRPTLDLVASYTDKGQHGGLSGGITPDRSRAAMLGLQLNVPLYTGGALNSREREAIAKQRQAESEFSAAKRDARLKVQDAYLSVQTGVSRIHALDQQQRSAQTALEATVLGRDVGNRTELDVLDAQQRLFSAQLDLAQARYDYLLGRVRLGAAAGDLTEADLRTLNAWLGG
jgi:outer membrane protein